MSRAASNESFYLGELVEIDIPARSWSRIDRIGSCKTKPPHREIIRAALDRFVHEYTSETNACSVPEVGERLKALHDAAVTFSNALGDFLSNGDVDAAQRMARELAREQCASVRLDLLHDDVGAILWPLNRAVEQTKGAAGREASEALQDCVNILIAVHRAAGGKHSTAYRKNKESGKWPRVIRWLRRILRYVPPIGAASYHDATKIATRVGQAKMEAKVNPDHPSNVASLQRLSEAFGVRLGDTE